MFPGEIIGTLEATVVSDGLTGVPLLWVQPIARDGSPRGKAIIACDSLGVGPGERVFVVEGREAAFALPVEFVPVDAAIVGIVDGVDTG